MSSPTPAGPPPAPLDVDGQQLDGQQVAPVVPDAPVVKQTERPHRLPPFLRGAIVLVAIAFTWPQQRPRGRADDFGAGSPLTVLPMVGLVVLLAATVGFCW